MKTQQRNFIIEIKSNGRRSAVRQGSIWGNTDLKAMARQAASAAPQLFEAPGESQTFLEKSVSLLPDTATVSPREHVETPLTTPEAEVQESIENDPVDTAPSEDTGVVAQDTRGAVMVLRKRVTNARARKVKPTQEVSELLTNPKVPVDELVALDLENRHLKALLVQHLRQQNRQLRDMLARLATL